MTNYRKIVWVALCLVAMSNVVTWRLTRLNESPIFASAVTIDNSRKAKLSQGATSISPVRRGKSVIPPLSLTNLNLPAGTTLTYGFDTSETATPATPLKSYLVALHSLKSATGKTAIEAVTFLSTAADGVFDPQSNPKEPHILFKQGDAYHDMGTYQLYVLNQTTGLTKTVAKGKRLSNRKTLWSPDGKYIAYVEGGDAEGHFDQRISSFLRLHVFDLKTGQDKVVIDNPTIGSSFSWQSPHTLLYGAALMQKEKTIASSTYQPSVSNSDNVDMVSRPNIYSYMPETGRTQLLIKDGFKPISSPNGQWIVFFGGSKEQNDQPLMKGWENYPQYSFFHLIVARNNGTQRKALRLESTGAYSAVQWLPDSERFAVMRYKKTGAFGRIQIQLCNRKTGLTKQITEVGIRNFVDVGLGEDVPQFYTLGTSADGKTLYLATIEFKGELKNSGLYKMVHTVYAINVATGRSSILAKLQNPLGVDWKSSAK